MTARGALKVAVNGRPVPIAPTGRPGAVRFLRGAYELDPDWPYDVAEARARGTFSGEFLAGVYSDWALEVGRSLAELSGPAGRAAGLN